MRCSSFSLIALLLAAPLAHAQHAAPARAGSVPAPASASGANADRHDLDNIRQFARVYEIVRQAYVDPVSNKTLMSDAIKGMLSNLDPHSAFLDKRGLRDLDEDTSGQYSGLGIEVLEDDGVLRIVTPIDDTPAARAGIRPGDVIVKVNGTLVDSDNIDALYRALRGKPGTKIRLTILHANSDKPVEMTLTRELISVSSVKVRELEPGYAYIRISQFQADTASDLEKKLGALIAKYGPQKGAILDLRNNPGGLVTAAVAVSDDFLNSGVIVSMRGRLPDANMTFRAHPGDLLDGAPMVDLVNNGTASAAEIVSGALKDNHRALIVGQRTFGKGVVQTVIPLDADHAVKITTARYYTPDGTSIQAEGIKPDIALGDDLDVSQGAAPYEPINSEAELPHHLANQNAGASAGINDDGSAQSAKLAVQDYELAQALNILKGMAMSRPAARSP